MFTYQSLKTLFFSLAFRWDKHKHRLALPGIKAVVLASVIWPRAGRKLVTSPSSSVSFALEAVVLIFWVFVWLPWSLPAPWSSCFCSGVHLLFPWLSRWILFLFILLLLVRGLGVSFLILIGL